MKDFETIKMSASTNGVCSLVLNRPEKHNALNALMIQELRQAANTINTDESIRVVILSAHGKSFCAGGDLNWMQAQANKDRAGKIEESSQLALMLQDLDSLSKPLIARVHGPAYGGGIGIMSVCDIVVAVQTTKFALTETRLGLIPATIGPYVIRRMGEGAARQVFMNAALFDAQRAQHLGLVSLLAEDEQSLDELVNQQANTFLNCAPGAIADAKALCQHLARNPNAEQLNYTANQLADRWETAEAQEGIKCFFAKEKPQWVK
jgi:methylglutaconyl-CoA hydratase